MSQTTVLIPKVGVVAFPNTMQGGDINKAVKTLHQKAVLKSVLKFVAKDPALVGLDTAEFYKQLSAIAAFLERYTSLARAADAGIHGEKVHDLPEVDNDLNAPVEPEEAPAKAEAPAEQSAEAEPEQEQPEQQEPEAEPTEQPEEVK
jgi:hypothetical protein